MHCSLLLPTYVALASLASSATAATSATWRPYRGHGYREYGRYRSSIDGQTQQNTAVDSQTTTAPTATGTQPDESACDAPLVSDGASDVQTTMEATAVQTSVESSAGSPSEQSPGQPSNQPSDQPSIQPSVQLSIQPSNQPPIQPSDEPSNQPSGQPSASSPAQHSSVPESPNSPVSSTASTTATTNSVKTAAATAKASNAASCNGASDVVRGVSLGGWLIVESWMLSHNAGSLFGKSGAFASLSVKDQWHADEYAQQNAEAQKAMINHWDTFYTQSDIAALPSYGINTVRIPIGYWAFTPKNLDTDTNPPYIRWALLPETKDYLKQAIDWCKAAGLRVMIDMHGSMLSQNGKDHSGHIINPWPGNEKWLEQAQNVDLLVELAKNYTTPDYKDTVFAIEITNEPKYSASLKDWTISTFKAIRAATQATNPDLKIIMHDAFYGATFWKDVNSELNTAGTNLTDMPFWLDLHLYQNMAGTTMPGTQTAWTSLDATQHKAQACKWATSALEPKVGNAMPIVVGEFTAQIGLCQNTQTKAITASDGCQGANCVCTWAEMTQWTNDLLSATRDYLRAEIQTFEANSRGWIIWSLKTDSDESPWSFQALVKDRQGFGQVLETPLCNAPVQQACT